jgi:hypothetical protein
MGAGLMAIALLIPSPAPTLAAVPAIVALGIGIAVLALRRATDHERRESG